MIKNLIFRIWEKNEGRIFSGSASANYYEGVTQKTNMKMGLALKLVRWVPRLLEYVFAEVGSFWDDEIHMKLWIGRRSRRQVWIGLYFFFGFGH